MDTAGLAAIGLLTKSGTGALILSASANTYDGTTSITAGTVRRQRDCSSGAATTGVIEQLVVTLKAAATLRLMYNLQSTPNISIDTAVTDADLRTSIENALRLLSSVNQSARNAVDPSGIVTVTNPSANTFSISFDVALRGSNNQLTAAATGPPSAATVTHPQAGGIGNTTVSANAAPSSSAG